MIRGMNIEHVYTVYVGHVVVCCSLLLWRLRSVCVGPESSNGWCDTCTRKSTVVARSRCGERKRQTTAWQTPAATATVSCHLQAPICHRPGVTRAEMQPRVTGAGNTGPDNELENDRPVLFNFALVA